MIISEKGQFHVNEKLCVFLSTMKKAIIAVSTYDSVCVYTNTMMSIFIPVTCVQIISPQKMIMMNLSSTEMILSVLNKCNPSKLLLKYKIIEIKNWLAARIIRS